MSKTIIQGEYGLSEVSGPPIKPEPARQDPSLDRIAYDDVLKSFGWNADTFLVAKTYHFPDPVSARDILTDGRLVRRINMYSRAGVTRWVQEITQFAAGLRRLR